MAVKMLSLYSQQLPRGVLPPYAYIHSSRLRQEFDEMENGEKGLIAIYSKDNYKKLLPAASFATSRNSTIPVTAAVH